MIVRQGECREEILGNGVRRVIKGHIEDLMVVELTWKKGQAGAVHHHPHRQCGYVVRGRFEADIDGRLTVIEAGDCYYTEADQPHGLKALEDGSVLLDIFTPRRDDFL